MSGKSNCRKRQETLWETLYDPNLEYAVCDLPSSPPTRPTCDRELLLRENRILRHQLEQHHITTRTSWPRGPASPHGSPATKSRLASARIKAVRLYNKSNNMMPR